MLTLLFPDFFRIRARLNAAQTEKGAIECRQRQVDRRSNAPSVGGKVWSVFLGMRPMISYRQDRFVSAAYTVTSSTGAAEPRCTFVRSRWRPCVSRALVRLRGYHRHRGRIAMTFACPIFREFLEILRQRRSASKFIRAT